MKIIKMFQSDLYRGIWLKLPLFVLPLMISLLTFFDGFNQFQRAAELGLTRVQPTFADFIFFAYGGMKKYIPTPENPFQFPIAWLVLFIVSAFVVLNYLAKDLEGIGAYLLVNTGSRLTWWVSKCFWNVIATLVYHVLYILGLWVLSLFYNLSISRSFHVDLVRILFNLETGTLLNQPTTLPLSVICLPILLSIALNLWEMVLTLFMKPVFSFLVVAILLLASTYLLTPWLVGNFGMMLRFSWLLPEGVSLTSGFYAVLILISLAITIGLVSFKKYDILSQD